uniref:OSIGBa0116O04.2 protein n=1 Tax=Oryza sativa TaxID=4530 RepID=Q01LT5_ORYSA|nr:OSIGBa0116O04.2 [Oryza sativa]
MGFVSGIDDFVFPPGQAFRFGSLDFITNDFGKISLLDSDSNQSGRGQISAPFGIPNSAMVYPKINSTELASNHSDEIQSTSTRPNQDDWAYPPILMKLPDDLAAVFTTRVSSLYRPRRDPASAPVRPSSREVGVILQPLGTVSTEQLDGYLSSLGVDSRPTEIVEYDDFGYRYDNRNLDNFDKGFQDNYTPLYFGIFMADNETGEQRKARRAEELRVQQEAERRRLEEERQAQERERLQPITLLDTLLKEDALNQANHVVNILTKTKTMIVASVPVNSASVRTPTGSRVPHLRSQDYHQPSLQHRRRRIQSQEQGVDWPAGFKPTRIEKYDGTTNPESWLTVYGLAIHAAGGDNKAMANYLLVALANSARSWLHGLPRGTIGSWAELRDHFIANFQGTFERPGTHFDLYNVIQKSGESLRDYIRCFSEQRNKISDITDDVIIAAFTKGIRHEDLVGKFGRKPPKTVKQMFEKANESLIDGGSALNILFAKTLDDMQIPRTELKPSNAPFHGVIPGLFSTPLGQITLPVTFGTRENFRTENVCFEVADFETGYHAILRRLALAKFMDVPHYTYMMMKMPGPRGVISLRSDIKQAVTCDKESCEMAQTREITIAREEIRLAASTASEGEMPATKMPKSGKSDAKTKKIPLDPSNPTKTALANPVLVRKKTGQWRMCVDYTDLNKSCPKDPFGLPHIDQVVDSTAGCELLSFLDCYSGYHQIRLKESDCLKTSFITPFGAYCYITMPFGLKNAGATYQCMIQRCFSTQISRNVEAYVDDVVVKTKQKDDLITYLEETFASIRAFRMKLNPEKCIFRVPSGKLLGFMVSYRGIQANPEKINAILNMKPPSSQKDVQKLTGCMAALNRFVSRLGERGMPLFKLLKKTDNFQWGPEAQKAFEDFKQLLTTPPVLASPHPRAAVVICVSDFPGCHSVTVVTSFPLRDIHHNREANGRIAKWALELMSLDISFKPRTSIKSQALADFIDEWTECQEDMPEKMMEYWTMHFDGSKRLSNTGAGVVLISPTGERLSYVFWIHFSASHNVAEYEALLHGLRIVISLGIRRLIVHGDSQLEVRKLEDKFDGLELTHVLRHNNEAADKLANFGSKREAAPSDLFVEHLYEPTVPRKETIEATDTQDTKMKPSGSPGTADSVIHETGLYKKSPSGILQRCVSLEEAQELQTIPLSSPFAVWGLDMVGPFKKAVGGYTHLFVAVDKFSKWIEAKPVITITADKARDFFINTVHRFGVPNRIITVNDTQFTGGVFKDFCEDFGIKICYASVAHPMSNGQVERANVMVLQGIKARVFDRLHPYAGKWVEQLPSVLWSLCTTTSRATGQSTFFLVYGAEAMLPSEVEFESLRFRNFNEERYGDNRVDDLNRLEEAREAALIQSARYLQGLRRYHNRNVQSRAFLVGDLVLRKPTRDRHKLSPLWEGPFIISEVTRPGSYRLKRKDGTTIDNSWNIEHLRQFYA